MDAISPRHLSDLLDSASAPLVFDLRRTAAFDADSRMLVPAQRVRTNALEDNVRFYRVVKGKREQLAGTNTKVATNTWHTLGLKADGDRFTVSYDGKELFDARDATFAQPGKVALWTKADSVTYFDSLMIRSLPE